MPSRARFLFNTTGANRTCQPPLNMSGFRPPTGRFELASAVPMMSRMARILRGLFGIFCALVAWPLSAQARGLRVAIFDFELIDTSLEGATNGPRADETARLVRLGDQLRMLVTRSGKLEVIDIGPVQAEAHKANLQACGGCDSDFAQKLGAELSITGTVQKVSNLILNINLYVRVVPTREPLVAMSVDIRGNTDESWSRGLEYLVRTRFLPAENRDPQ
jgi:Protein of unknown function (DUF2380)